MKKSPGILKKNLFVISAAEFIVLLAFGLYDPFLPLYIQEAGKFSNEQAALWSGITTGGEGLAMFIFLPVWGIVADRWGRKPMVLRPQFGGVIVALLFILAPNV
ncbi:MAG: MFS transporter [Dehalococcoidales bacterium]|nr:MFS transporter [Dehalococcoidales bacterium]